MRHFLVLLILAMPARADEPPRVCPPCACDDEPVGPQPPTIRVVLDSSGTFIERGTARFGPYPVQPNEVATSPDGVHFALAFPLGVKHWQMVIDGTPNNYLGPDKIHALTFESDRLLIYHEHWNGNSSYQLVWITP